MTKDKEDDIKFDSPLSAAQTMAATDFWRGYEAGFRVAAGYLRSESVSFIYDEFVAALANTLESRSKEIKQENDEFDVETRDAAIAYLSSLKGD